MDKKLLTKEVGFAIFMVVVGSFMGLFLMSAITSWYLMQERTPQVGAAEIWLSRLNIPINPVLREEVYVAPIEDKLDMDSLLKGKCRFYNAVSNGYIYFGRVKGGGYHMRGVILEDNIKVIDRTCPPSRGECAWEKVFGAIYVQDNVIKDIRLFGNIKDSRDLESVTRLIYYLTGLYSARRGAPPEVQPLAWIAYFDRVLVGIFGKLM